MFFLVGFSRIRSDSVIFLLQVPYFGLFAALAQKDGQRLLAAIENPQSEIVNGKIGFVF